MEILPSSDATALKKAQAIILQGGIVAHPTETCYGLACDLTNSAAIARLFALKKRPVDQPVSALFASIDDAKQYVEWGDIAEGTAQKYLPGPLTLVLPMKGTAPHRLFLVPSGKKELRSGDQEVRIGIRVSNHPVAKLLAELSGIPLSTTSANLHGKPEPYFIEEISADLILDGGALPPMPPSTVVAIKGKRLCVLRQGGIRLTAIHSVHALPSL